MSQHPTDVSVWNLVPTDPDVACAQFISRVQTHQRRPRREIVLGFSSQGVSGIASSLYCHEAFSERREITVLIGGP